jgi:hypothetical protein
MGKVVMMVHLYCFYCSFCTASYRLIVLMSMRLRLGQCIQSVLPFLCWSYLLYCLQLTVNVSIHICCSSFWNELLETQSCNYLYLYIAGAWREVWTYKHLSSIFSLFSRLDLSSSNFFLPVMYHTSVPLASLVGTWECLLSWAVFIVSTSTQPR